MLPLGQAVKLVSAVVYVRRVTCQGKEPVKGVSGKERRLDIGCDADAYIFNKH